MVTSLEVSEARDHKGLHQKARGEISGFTGVNDPYEAPAALNLVLDGEHDDVDTLAGRILSLLGAG